MGVDKIVLMNLKLEENDMTFVDDIKLKFIILADETYHTVKEMDAIF